MPDQLLKQIEKKELLTLTKEALVEMYISTYDRLKVANLKLAMSRVTIADQAKSIRTKSKALRSNSSKRKSMSDTIKRRRKTWPK
jgi:hypothetical protein